MAYRVIKVFTDLQDNNHKYKVGDMYPRDGVVVSDKRLAELLGSKNKRNMPVIKEIPEKVSPLPEEVSEDKKTGEMAITESEPKKKPRKGKKTDDRTDT